MISVDEAFEQYAQVISPLPPVEAPLASALGRVLGRDVSSPIDLPPFPQSAMDGYALRAGDCRTASAEHPARLRLVGTIAAGKLAQIPRLSSGEALRIFTGGHLPQGADAVLRQEDAQVEGDTLLVRRALPAGQDIREQGEELQKGDLLARAGSRITPGLLGALAIAGLTQVQVHRAPRISLLTTGDEVVAGGQELQPGEVYDANSHLVTAWLRAGGYRLSVTDHLADDLELTKRALAEALVGSDLVITVGGVSVGERDYILAAAESVGVEQVFWRVRQRPGKPLFFGRSGEKLLLGLPGNPGAVFVGLLVHLRRALDLLEGAARPRPGFLPGRLADPLVADAQQDIWLRSRMELSPRGEAWLHPLPHQSSHMISNLAACTVLVRIPAGRGELSPGEIVTWIPSGPLLGAKQGVADRP